MSKGHWLLLQLTLAALLIPFFPLTAQQQQSLSEARDFYDKKEYDSAILVLNHILARSPAIAVEADALLLLAQNHNRKRDYKARLTFAGKSADIARANPDLPDSLKAFAFKEKGDALIRFGQYDSSIYYLGLAEPLFASIQNWQKQAECFVGTGSNLYRKRAYQQADTVLRRAQRLLESKFKELPGIYGATLNLLGAVHRRTGDLEKSLDNSLKAVRFREQRPDDEDRLMVALNNLGTAHYKRADYDKALEALERAETLGIKDTNRAKTLSSIYNNLMLVYLKKKHLDKALQYGQSRKTLIDSEAFVTSEASLLLFHNNLALVYMETNQFDLALEELLAAQNLKKDAFQTLSNLGYFYFKTGNDPEAKRYLNQAIETRDSDNPDVAKLYRYLAEIAGKNQDHEETEMLFAKSMALAAQQQEGDFSLDKLTFDKLGWKRELLRTLSSYGNYHLDLGNNEKAADILLKAVSLLDYMYLDHKAEGSRIFLKAEGIPLYESAIRSLATQVDQKPALYEQVLAIFEKVKANQLGDFLQVRNANLSGGVPVSLIERERSLRIDISFYETEEYLASVKGDSIKAALYQNYRLDKINQLDQLIEQFEREYPRYFQVRHKKTVPTLASIRANFQSQDELLVEFFVGNNSLYVLAISNTEQSLLRLGQAESLKRLSKAFVQLVNNTDLLFSHQQVAFDKLSNRGFALYQRLLAPVFNTISNPPNTLHIIPDGFLNYVPFEALLTSDSEHSRPDYIGLPYLIKSCQVRYSYAASLPALGHSNSRTKTLAIAPFSNTDLPHTQTEIEGAQAYFPTTLQAASSATKSLFESSAGDFNILHLATHGIVDEKNPKQSYLRFASTNNSGKDEERLHVYELENMNLKADLAILSACETGIGQFISGEGVMSLARGFRYAGVPSILMSLWPVDDKSGGELIAGFYEGLSQKVDKAGALHQAKLNYLENTDQLHAHPYFWSQFVLIGDPAPLKNGILSVFLFVTLAVLLAVLLIILFIRFKLKR